MCPRCAYTHRRAKALYAKSPYHPGDSKGFSHTIRKSLCRHPAGQAPARRGIIRSPRRAVSTCRHCGCCLLVVAKLHFRKIGSSSPRRVRALRLGVSTTSSSTERDFDLSSGGSLYAGSLFFSLIEASTSVATMWPMAMASTTVAGPVAASPMMNTPSAVVLFLLRERTSTPPHLSFLTSEPSGIKEVSADWEMAGMMVSTLKVYSLPSMGTGLPCRSGRTRRASFSGTPRR